MNSIFTLLDNAGDSQCQPPARAVENKNQRLTPRSARIVATPSAAGMVLKSRRASNGDGGRCPSWPSAG
jgi:hypothetical protein